MSEPPNFLKPLAAGLGARFDALERRARTTIELAERVRTVLPCPEKDHVTSASYREETLIVLADSAAWAARIRYMQELLLTQLSNGETQFTKLKVKVGRTAE